jgi:spore germination cell wall hydrolase CwlJ-like protein
MPLVLLLIAVTVFACNALLTPQKKLVEIATAPSLAKPVSAPAVKSVDPAELRCMSENIYFEAGGESLAGKMAVGLVVINRMKNPAYPKTVCGVVHQKNGDTCMFSWLCEVPKEVRNSANWQQSQAVAHRLLSRDVDDLTDGSTNFHGMSVNPKWNLKPTVRIDGHQFYR